MRAATMTVSPPTASSNYVDATRLEADPIRHQLLVPSVLRVVGDVAGCSVADIGCGPGMFLSAIESQGPRRLVACDYASEMLALAAEQAPSAELLRFDISVGPLPGEEFDRILCIMVLHTIECLDLALHNLACGLSPRGLLTLCVPHPCFHYSQVQIDGWSSCQPKYRREDVSYPQQRELVNRFGYPQVEVKMFHRPISAYIDGILSAGLELTMLVEPCGHTQAPWNCIPPFLILQCRKP